MATETNWGDRLGQILMQGSRDYMNISLANQADERNRARQLEDRAVAEAGEERRFQRGLTAQREDNRLARDSAFQSSILQALVQNGFLAPADVGNPEAVAAAYAQAQESGLIKRYENLITQGLLDPADIAKPEKVKEALDKLGDSNREMTESASAEVTRLRDEGIRVGEKMQDLELRLAEPAQMPSDQKILARAVQLAQQAKPGKTPSQEDIQSFTQQAAEELTQQAQIQKYQSDQAARQQQVLLNNQAMDIRRRQENLESRFRVAPDVYTPPAAAPVSAAPSGPVQASAADRAATIAAAIREATGRPADGAAAPAATPSSFQNTFNDPEIAAYNERQEAAQVVNRIRPLQAARQSAEDRVRIAQANIDRLKANPSSSGNAMNPAFAPSVNQYGIPAPATNQYGIGPSDNRVRELNRMYVELQQGQQDLTAAEKALLEFQNTAKRGTTPAPTKTPAVSNPVFAPPPQTPFDPRLSLQPAM